jgi:exopolysaccharide biosynthesis polyprenyl glycosylphosphotransferase
MTTTQRFEPYAEAVLEVDDAALRREREISIFVQPDVALHQSKAGTARRLFARRALRTVTFATGDGLAAGASAVLVRQAVESAGRGHIPFSSASEFVVAVVLALALTGNYRRSTPSHATQPLLLGSALGALVVSWAPIWPLPTIPAMSTVALLTFVTACALFLMRGVVTALTGWLLPEARRLVPAIAIAGDASMNLALDPESGFRVEGTIVLDGHQTELRAQELARMIRRTRAESVVVMGDLRNSFFARVLEISLRAGCEVLATPPGFGVAGVLPTVARRGPYGLIQIGAPSLKTPQFFAKRVVDVVGAGLALVVTAPLWLVIAAVIKLDSPGPVLFRQERVGLGGRRFRMLKFRTMRCGADDEKESVAHLNASGDARLFKIPNDPRISRVGGFLRRWSLDELPQFLNVIAGSMSLVGPRPFFERDFAEYEAHHFRRLGAKPGISGLWQVFGRSSVLDFEEVVRLDTEYIDRWSLWLDLKILTMTLPAVVGRTGAY